PCSAASSRRLSDAAGQGRRFIDVMPNSWSAWTTSPVTLARVRTRGGSNIYPRGIEEVISGHPTVYEVAVIGIPDVKWGEAVKALVVTRPGATATEPEIIEHVRQPRLVQEAAERGVPARAAEERLRQDPQARAARTLLDRARPARASAGR